VTDDGVRHSQPIGATDEDRRALNNGSGDAQARAFELALTPAIMGFFGYWLDRWLGTTPVFLVGLVLVTAVYLGWKFYVRYDEEMRAHEAKLFKPAGQRRAGPPPRTSA
jgi:F0F1-type ATP synthase assembly protein I